MSPLRAASDESCES